MALFLKHLQNYRNLIINTSIEEKYCKILKKACKTRWLSFDASIQAVWEELVPVVQILSAVSESDATAYGLLKRMNCTIFVGIVYILKEILPVLASEQTFQRGYFNFSSLQPKLECAQGELQHISDNLNTNLEKDIQFDGRLGLLALELKDRNKTYLQHTLENYVQALIDNISKRFPDVAILSALGIFNPVIIPDQKEYRVHAL
ncbi:unnamed protein product [Mytilus edulis]|uniref:Uncharacterized protein n=1 Tax=Mytilus edulis TaxID=6550 RepID=A0A8S3SP16_MYTED|nr:unnamed protein product [Mytilus edulis]